jgi:hypothetical protein
MVIGWKVNYRDPYLYLGFAALLAWGLLLARSLIARRWDLFLCLCCLALSYGMVANAVVLIGTNLGERLLYMPSVFFILILAVEVKGVRPVVLGPAVLACVLLGGAWSMINAHRWNDRFHFYQWSVDTQPKSVRVYGLLYNEYADRQDWYGARRVGLRCRAALPQCWEAYQMCILPYLELGDLDAALEAADAGIQNCPTIELKMLRSDIVGRIEERKRALDPHHRESTVGAGMTGGGSLHQPINREGPPKRAF